MFGDVAERTEISSMLVQVEVFSKRAESEREEESSVKEKGSLALGTRQGLISKKRNVGTQACMEAMPCAPDSLLFNLKCIGLGCDC